MTTLHELTEAPWFVAVDLSFHLAILWHVVAHVCRAGRRLHRWVHEPLLDLAWRHGPTRWWVRLSHLVTVRAR